MARIRNDKQELLRFYRELMSDENKTVQDDHVTYRIVRNDGTISQFEYQRPYYLDDWKEPTPESVVADVMKYSKPKALTRRELERSSLRCQEKMVFIGNHRQLIPFLLEFAKTDKEQFSCFREFIYWTVLRHTNYKKRFPSWYREICPDITLSEERDMANFDRHIINTLPVAWIPEEYKNKRNNRIKKFDLFDPSDDYADKPKKIDLETALKKKSVFWIRNKYWIKYEVRYVKMKCTYVSNKLWEIQPINKCNCSEKLHENYIREKYQDCWCSFEELQDANIHSEFLI